MNHGPLTATVDSDAPPRNRIYVDHRDGRPAIFMPRALFRGRMWMIFAFGLPFLVMPMMIEVGSGKFMAHLVFQTIGIAIVGCGVFLALIRQVIVDDGEQLVIVIDLFGRAVHYSDVLKRDIDRIAIRAIGDTKKRTYFAVYLDASAEREFAIGTCLSKEELDWLRRTIESWVRRGSDL